MACGVALLLGFELWRSHAGATMDAERNVDNLVHVLSEQTARTLQSIDLNIQGVVAELQGQPDLATDDARFRASLRKRLASLPYARALFVIGADGYIVHDTDYPLTPRVSLADRPYFTSHEDDPSLELHIGHPLQSRSVGRWFVSLSRRVNRPDGSFGGIVVAAMEPLYFEQFYRQLWVGSGTIALLLDDGTVFARSPRDEAVMGASFSGAEPFRDPDLDEHVYWTSSLSDGVRRVAGYKKLEGFPVVVLVTLSEDEVMQPWRAHAGVVLIGALILLALIAAVEWLSRSHRAREARALAQLMESQRLESIGRFAGGVVHDMGNLLRVMRSTVALLRPETAGQPTAQGLLDQIDDTLDVGGNLVNQMLFYARSGNAEPKSMDVNALVAEALSLLRRAAGPLVSIRVTFSQSSVSILTDVPQFQAALLNIVLNARDSRARGGTIAIEVRELSGEERNWAEIRVSDNGSGMSTETLGRVFDPFFTTKQAGNGLGLSQVRTFVEYSKGMIAIDSLPGAGTTIWLRMPAVAPARARLKTEDGGAGAEHTHRG
jgi:signal transduction histidine kinase